MYRPPPLPPRSGGKYASTFVGFCYAPLSIHSTNARVHTHTMECRRGWGCGGQGREEDVALRRQDS